MSSVKIDEILNQVRVKLRENGIKLWETPYFVNGEAQEDILQDLGRNFAQLLGLPEEACIIAVQELQNTAIDKLRAREKFQDSGVAALKVKIPRQSGTDLLNIEIKLSETGQKLRELLAEKTSTNPNKIKVIAKGKVIEDFKSLAEQQIVNNQQLIALIVSNESESEANIYDRVAKIKADAKLLNTESLFSLENQDGGAIYLPANEKEALVMGLALYEKGRAAMTREHYSEALVLLLEADDEFSTCQSKLLQTVDNYALLNLDIVWCYLCLKSITQLPDAERRLRMCEESFHRTYGSSFDRVAALKGGEGNEKALMMRLHLLQAILCFHMNRRSEAQGLLMLAESELNGLKIDETKLTVMIEMGYLVAEARIGLRAANNNVEAAVGEIMQRRERRQAARQKVKKERKLLGKFSKSNVNPNALQQLVDMGFQKEMAAMALKKTDNSIERAIGMLQEKLDELERDLVEHNAENGVEDLLNQLIAQGFNLEAARKALEQCGNNLAETIAMLTQQPTQSVFDQPGPSGNAPPPSNDLLKKVKKSVEQKRDAAEAMKRFREDLNSDEDDYLDLPLAQEEQLIVEYKGFLNMQ